MLILKEDYGPFDLYIKLIETKEIRREDLKSLAEIIRSRSEVPKIVLDFLADYISGELKLKRGRRELPSLFVHAYQISIEDYMKQGLSQNQALEKTAQYFNISKSAIVNVLPKYKKKKST